MTSKFEDKKTQNKVIESLEHANAELSDSVLDDIAQARMNAIRAAHQQGEMSPFQRYLRATTEMLRRELLVNNLKFAAPLAVAVVVTVLVSYDQSNSIPAFPAELMSGDIPSEELAMLEDLEFASWLAEQQSENYL